MGLKLLLAGCSKDERQLAEDEVRRALGTRVDRGAWTVSLVRLTRQWSVTVDGPTQGVRALVLVAPEGRLAETIAEALTPRPPAPPQTQAKTPEGRPPDQEGRAPYRCEKCGEAFVLVYEAPPEEDQETVKAACPHCWHVNHVLVAASVAASKDFRVEKA